MNLRRQADSFRYAFQGIADLMRTQPNTWVHTGISLVVVGAGFYFGLSRLEWVAVILCIAIVFALEAMNTALEYLTDLVSPGYHPLAGKAKDVAAAAVLLAAFGAMAVGLLIFGPKVVAWFQEYVTTLK